MERVLFAPRDLPPVRPDVAADLPRYRKWQARRQAERLAGASQANRRWSGQLTATSHHDPEIAVLVALDGPDPDRLRQSLRCLTEQTVDLWQISIAVVGGSTTSVEAVLAAELGSLPPGKAIFTKCPEGTEAAEATAAAFDRSDAPVIMLLDPGDQLAPDAIALLLASMADADIVYGDEDGVDEDGELVDPALKPDWSPDLLLSTPYLGRPLAFRRTTVEAAGGIRPIVGGEWEHDLMLRATEQTGRVAHIAEVLCHRRAGSATPESRTVSGPAAVMDALVRRHEVGHVELGPITGSWAVHRETEGEPSISVLIPFRDAAPFLRACVDSVTATADGVDLELILVDNGSTEPETLTLVEHLATRDDVVVVRDDRPFNWAALNNGAAAVARGEVLLFLNNDIEALRPGWLRLLAAHALRPSIGAVGARLLYPTGRVQHAGVVIGVGGAAGHVPMGLASDQPGYLGMAVLTRDCSAVTGACLAIRREVFDELGRFDESLGLDLNDIDLCLRARQRGLQVVFEPLAELLHYESPSRGTSGSVEDIIRFIDRWEDAIVQGDPFLNRNLTRIDSSCALREPDEEGWWQAWRSTLGTL